MGLGIGMEAVLAIINELSPGEQATIWRVLGEELLRAGNPFDVLIRGMPLLEQAIQLAQINFPKAQEGA